MKDFFARLFRRRNRHLVPYYDFTTKKTMLIPRAELSPGVVQIQIQGQAEPVYADAAQLKLGEYRHPKFQGEEKLPLESLAEDLADVYPLSYDEWEDGFRRDLNPAQEIAGWLHLAAILKVMSTQAALGLAEKKECFRILVACINGPRETVRDRSDPKILSEELINQTIAYFYEGGYR